MESFVDELPKAELHLHLVAYLRETQIPPDAAGDVSGDVSAETRA